MKKNIIITFSAVVFLSFVALPAKAAVFQLLTDKETAAIGDSLTITVIIDSEGTGINAAEATLQFPNNILEATEISKENSIFNFWLEEPSFSNEDGLVNFIGGSSSGFSGRSLHLININFNVRGSGQGEIVFLDGAAAASDGSGTNVLTEMRGVTVNILPITGVLPGITPSPVPPVEIIERPAVPTGELPEIPSIQVPLYPNEGEWNNLVSRFYAIWPLPNDVTGVATLLDKNPTSNPSISEGLFESKTFLPLSDGIWYLHVRFRNDIGWGETAHYKISIDTTPPLPFVLELNTEEISDNPSPFLSYKSADDLSGLKHYVIAATGEEADFTFEESYIFKPLSPGKYLITVRAVDRAGNIVEESVDVEILPIESPIITFTSEKVVLDEESIRITGTALQNEKIKIILFSENGDIIAEDEVAVDGLGNWSKEFREPVRKGKYFIEVQTIDSRGAKSLFVRSSIVTVVEKPFLVIAGINITQMWFFIFLIAILLSGFAIGWFSYKLRQKQLGRRVVIAQRDVFNVFAMIEKDIDKILKSYEDNNINERELTEAEYILKKIKENLKKTQKYIIDNIGEINK